MAIVYSGLHRGGLLVPRPTLGPQSLLCCSARSGKRYVAAYRRDVVWLRRNGIRRRPAVSVWRPRPVWNDRSNIRSLERQGWTTTRAGCPDANRPENAHTKTTTRKSRTSLNSDILFGQDVVRDGKPARESKTGLDGRSFNRGLPLKISDPLS